LQVIVKLATIHLTPENPSHKGGAWHMEGMANEDIIATGIYYYSHHNITHSKLAFRMAVNGYDRYDMDCEPGDKTIAMNRWGFEDEDKLVQNLGVVSTLGGRCLAFPNTLQHQVGSLKSL
jgi:Protein of unknown function (DUF4246)